MQNIVTVDQSEKIIGGDDIFFIAEIGKNFIESEEDRPIQEYLENAKKLVDAAIDAGADAVKFQTHVREDEVLSIDFTSPHFNGSDRYSWVGRNEAATPCETFWKPLKAYCDEKGTIFFSTPMSKKAAELLEDLSVPLWKIGSGDVQDYLMLDYLIETKKPIMLSSGMVSLAELDEIVRYITVKGAPLIVFYCISQYPCPPEAFNLGTITYLREKYPNVIIGFSDHSITHNAVFGAMQLGAKVIEKHFSFSRDLWGSDHKASITPDEFREMVDAGNSGFYKNFNAATFYGDMKKELEGAKNKHRPYFNKALMAGIDIKKGTVITADMLYAMRPVMLAGGLPANKLHSVVGKKAAADINKYNPITEDVVA